MATYNHVCELCGKEFSDYFENTKFCCRDCYDKNRKRISICQWCGKEFNNPSGRQKYCSRSCSSKSQSKKVELVCAVCGIKFERRPYGVREGANYCSRKCSDSVNYWNEGDLEFVKNNYGELSIKQIADALEKTYSSVKAVIRYHGYSKNRKWTEAEEQIIIDNYDVIRVSEIMKLLPNRTRPSIIGKARCLGMKGCSKFTEEQNDYIRDNYLNKTNEEMADFLHKTPSSIASRIWVLGLSRPKKGRDPMTELSEYIRGRLMPWKSKYMADQKFTCSLTDKERGVVIHHIKGFNLILEEALDELELEIKDSIGEYSEEELNLIFEKFFEIHESEQLYVCISDEVHKQFHGMYGYGNNTEEQWNEFIKLYFNK